MRFAPRLRFVASALLLVAAAAAQVAAPSVASAKEGRPNVLLIMADDLRPELGCYGVAGIKTPHIDALAARSVRFDRAYVQYPLCNPQRSSILTGRYPTQTGVLDNRQWWGREHPEWKTIPRYFRDHGYRTLSVGKIFHIGIDDPAAWTEGGAPRRYPDDASESIDSAASGRKAVQSPPAGPALKTQTAKGGSGSDRIVVLEGDGSTYQDYQHATRTIEHLRHARDHAQPFFLACGFTNPHSPPRAPQRLLDLYDVEKIPLPVDFAARPTVPPGFPEMSVVPRNTDLFIGRDGEAAQAREMKRAYWAAVSFLDEQVGRVLRALDETGQRDNTIVVLWGDHGYHLGEKGRWSKAYSLFDVALRSPLLIAAPGVTSRAGAVCARPVEALNLYKTLADLCALPAPAFPEGASMVPLLREPTAAWDRPAYSVVAYRDVLGRSVRTDRWRYSQWVEGERGEVLFDEQNDPHELKNLAADPAHAAKLAELRALLAGLPGRRR